jgi:hypothetical protein
VTPATYEVGRHLIEGLKNPTVVQDTTALEVFSIRRMGIREAIQRALGEDKAVPNPSPQGPQQGVHLCEW